MDAIQWGVHVWKCLEVLVYCQQVRTQSFLGRQLTIVMFDSIFHTVGYMLAERYCSAV
jgi:hypothetical protein